MRGIISVGFFLYSCIAAKIIIIIITIIIIYSMIGKEHTRAGRDELPCSLQ